MMIWGCLAAVAVDSFEFINSTMDKFEYLDILKRYLKHSAEKLGLWPEV